MRSEGFPFIVWGSGGWTLVRLQLVVASFSRRFWRRFRVVNSVSIEKAAKPRLFCCAHVAMSMGEAAKHQSLLVLWHRRVYRGSCKTSFVLLRSRRCVYGGSCKNSASACPLASPCLSGKLQNLVCFAALTSPCLCGKQVVSASFVVHSSTGK